MTLFKFGEKESTPTSSAPDPASSTDQGSVSRHQIDAATKAARDDLERSPRRRARRDTGDVRNDQRALQAAIDQRIVESLESVHDPKAWSALLCLPADAALTLTGNKRWDLETRERETLGVTGSTAARTLMITNPRALAFTMLGAALFSTYIPRAIAQLKEMRDNEAAKARAAQQQPEKKA